MHRQVAAIVPLALALALLSLAPSGARADTNLVEKGEGMEARLFRPAVDTKGHFTQDSTPVLPHLSLSLGLMLDFGFNQWVAPEQDDDLIPDAYSDTTVDRYITTVLMFNLGLFDRAVVGLQLPLIIPAGHMYYQDEDMRRGWSSKGTFGDLAVHAKFHITRANFHLIGLGLVLQYQAPTGKSELLTGEPGGGAVSGKVIVDVEPANWYRAALNVGARYAFGLEEENHLNWNGPTSMLLFEYGPLLTFGLGQSFVLWPGLMDFVLEAYGNQLASGTGFGDTGYTSMEVAGGFKFYVEENSYLMAGYAHGIPLGGGDDGYGFQAMEHRMFLGFAFEPSMPDADGDGIPDAWDQCPHEAEDRDSFEDSDGCPDPDNDGDGVCDPWVVKEGLEARHAKACKGEDLCPLIPGEPENKGCPPPPESEEDRVKIEEEQQDVEVIDGAIKTLKKIYFEYNSDEIKEESFPILDQVSQVISDNPQIDLIEVQGHADERGPERYNLTLTTKRAAAVKRYLAKKGVDAKRLRSMGYGEYCPIKIGTTEEDWEENRRVEFKVLKVHGAPTGVDTGCPRAKRKGIVSPPVK